MPLLYGISASHPEDYVVTDLIADLRSLGEADQGK